MFRELFGEFVKLESAFAGQIKNKCSGLICQTIVNPTRKTIEEFKDKPEATMSED